jgi:predicted nucleotidyltransferase
MDNPPSCKQMPDPAQNESYKKCVIESSVLMPVNISVAVLSWSPNHASVLQSIVIVVVQSLQSCSCIIVKGPYNSHIPLATIIEERLPAIRSLCKQLGVSRLWIFGSVARGEWDPSRSDVDFLVEFSPDHLPADQLLGLYAGLTEMFPCRIDLVSMRAVKNKLFRLELEETRVALYAAA